MKSILILFIGLVVGGSVVHLYYQSSIFSGGPTQIYDAPSPISADTANAYFKKYHENVRTKLKTKTEDGIVDIKTFVIRQSIIEHFAELVQRDSSNNSNLQQAGLALTLGENGNGSTLIVTALVCNKDANREDIRGTRHLLPRDNSDTRYIYDHLDLCPSTCPANSPSFSESDYYRGNAERSPRYNPDQNYWLSH